MTANMAWNDFLKSLVLFVDGSKSSRGFWENELTVSLTVESSPGVVFAVIFTKPQERYSRAGVKVMLKLASIFRIRTKLLAFVLNISSV